MKSPLPKALRVLIPAVLIVAWLVGASIGGPYFGKVSEVSTNDQTSYLPESADATQVQGLLDDFLGSDSIPAVVVFASDDELSDETLADLEATVADLPEIEGVTDELSPLIPSEDGLAAQAFVPISTDADTGDVLDE
ncbi:MAG: MMPL family transporter, partial [Agrococcus casei]